MPTHTIPSALLHMYHDIPGAPWIYPTWQRLTGIQHGLTPATDVQLPKGWTRENVEHFKSYESQYKQLPKEDKKIKFSAARLGSAELPGRAFWRTFTLRLWSTCGLHTKISGILSHADLHPMRLAATSDPPGQWPASATWAPLAVDPVSLELFGPEALDEHGRLRGKLRPMCTALITRTWLNLYNQYNRCKGQIEDREQQATKAFESKLCLFQPAPPSETSIPIQASSRKQ
jgi:TATA-binding protein-associated factor